MPYLIAVMAGMMLWIGGSELTGRRETWDSGLYWTVFYPLALAACGLLGYLFPLGLIVFGVLSLPGIAVAKLGARMKEGAAH